MAASAFEFWKRFDDLRDGEDIKAICEKTGIKYSRVRENRSEVRFMKQQDMEILSNYLGTTVEYLMFGDTESSDEPPRVRAIMEKLRTASDMELEMVERILGIGK